MLAIVVSRADSASERIGDQLLRLAEWDAREDSARPDGAGGGTYYRTDGAELRTFEELHLHVEGVAEGFDDPDLLAFASRHSGETGALLSAHHTGNFGRAEYGGADGSLAEAAPNALRRVRGALAEYAPEGYDVGIECTHHGPSDVGCPSLFVELGSGEPQWSDPAGAEAVARAILDLRGVDPNGTRSIVGFGGGHYAPRFDRVLVETDWGVGHVAADWCIASIDGDRTDVVEAAFAESDAERALLDGDHPQLVETIEGLGYELVSETWLRETDGVDLDVVERVEAELSSIDSGLRFGADATIHAGGITTAEIPTGLLEEANGIDREAVRSAVAERTVAYETSEGATLVSGAVALGDGVDLQSIVEALAAVLERKYDDIAVREDAVLARREAFDPELARRAGVEEGPAFGKLSAGETVEVDGETVAPDDVTSARERRFRR